MKTKTPYRPSPATAIPPARRNHSSGQWAIAGLAAFLAVAAPPVLSAAETPPPAAAPSAPAATPPKPHQKWRDFSEVVKDTERFEGLFTLYKTNDTLYAAIKPNVMDQPLLAPIAIARGLASAGTPLNFGDEWILMFHKEGDKIQLLRRNVHYQAPAGSPLEKAVKQNYTDSVLMSLPIVTMNGGDALVDFSQIFMTDFANLRLGNLDRNRCSWHKIKTFQNNIELEVEVTFAPGGMRYSMGMGDDGVADARGITLVIHYSLAKLPEAGYHPRYADHRVGHFISANKDFGSTDPDTQFVRQINRWRLEKADPKAKISAPKRQLIWWVEDTVPHEYRPYVQDGILEWNKAFEKIGFRDAIGVRWQNERDDFDPEDINYCTFRWITTPSTYAMSGLRANPLTGEMIDGDVIFDASWIRAWKTEYAFLVGKPIPSGEGPLMPLAAGEIISPIMAAKQGFGLPTPLPGSLWNNPLQALMNKDQSMAGLRLVPSDMGPTQMLLNERLNPGHFNACCYVSGMNQEFSLAAMVMASASDKKDEDNKLPEEFLGQAIKEVVMHEVGHSLGLRHNFKASTMLKPEELNDTSITRVKGMSGSVMDYNPLNFAPKGQKQGDYASTTLGPYDYWAIEYAYKPVDGDEAAELKKIAARSPEKDLTYATDEDMYLNDDPYVNTYDLGSDPMRYGMDRIALAEELLKNLDDKVIKNGESWARLRSAFSVLLYQYGDATYMASAFIGGHEVSRDFKGAENSHDPVTPIPGAKQREALQFLVDKILSGKSFQYSPQLLRRLTTDNWYHWGNESLFYSSSGIDFPIYGRILALQRIVLNRCLNGAILARLQNQELQSDSGKNPLRISEVFDTLTDAIFPDPKSAEDAQPIASSQAIMRRNLQRDYLRRLVTIVLGSRRGSLEDQIGFVMFSGGSDNVPADARSLARAHLKEINARIGRMRGYSVDKTTAAHLQECEQRITKVLEASYTAND